MFVGVVGAVSVEPAWPGARGSAFPANRGQRIDQREQLGDVVGVATSECDCEWNPGAIGDQVVLRPSTRTVDRRGAYCGAPFSARTWEPSTTALSSSSPSNARR